MLVGCAAPSDEALDTGDASKASIKWTYGHVIHGDHVCHYGSGLGAGTCTCNSNPGTSCIGINPDTAGSSCAHNGIMGTVGQLGNTATPVR